MRKIDTFRVGSARVLLKRMLLSRCFCRGIQMEEPTRSCGANSAALIHQTEAAPVFNAAVSHNTSTRHFQLAALFELPI